MLAAVMDKAPNIFPFVHSNYAETSHLFWGNRCLQSAEGVQQGDPLGPLFFCLSIQHITTHLKSELSLLYLDDWTVGGLADDVVSDLSVIEQAANELGLHLNRSKSEAICHGRETYDFPSSELPEFKFIHPDQATLLGSPLGNLCSISSAILGKVIN